MIAMLRQKLSLIYKSQDRFVQHFNNCKNPSQSTQFMSSSLTDNNVIRFVNISKRKSGIFANFKVRGIRAGVVFSASIAVDIAAAEVGTEDALEKIIEECARIGVAEFKKAEFRFEGLAAI